MHVRERLNAIFSQAQLSWEQGGVSSVSGSPRRVLAAVGAGELPALPTRGPPAPAQAPQRCRARSRRNPAASCGDHPCSPPPSSSGVLRWNTGSLCPAGCESQRVLCSSQSAAGVVSLWSGAAGLWTSDEINERLYTRNSKSAESK